MRLNNKHGFTLIELVMVVVIIGIMSAIAVPAIMAWLPNMRLKAAARDLYSNMQNAKIEAAKRNMSCAVTFNQLVGTTNCVYIVYVDSNRNFKYDAVDPILTKVVKWPKDVFLDTSKGGGDGLLFPNDAAVPPHASIFFMPNTLTTKASGGVANGTVFFKNTSANTYKVIVRNTGGIVVSR